MSVPYQEPAAFIFPLPPELKKQYAAWSENLKSSWGNDKLQGEGFTPVFVPIYPASPGAVPYPAGCQGIPGGSSCGGASINRFPGINPFILFLILILLLLGTRKEQILAALRRLILQTDKSPREKK